MFPARIFCCCLALVSLHAFAAPVDLVPRDFANATQPQVAVAPDGRIHVVFGKRHAIYHTSSTDGRTFSAPVEIGELDKLALGRRRGPRIAATERSVIVTAASHADGNLHSWISTDLGATWIEGERINRPANSAREGLHAMAGGGPGLVAVAWLDLRNGPTELWSRVSHDAGRTWAPETRIYASPEGPICQCCHPSLAIGPGDPIVAAWRNSLAGSRDIWMAESHDGGKTFAAARKIGTGTWKLNACPMDGGGLAVSPTGAPASVWRRDRTVFLSTNPGAEEKLADNAAQPVIGFAGDQPVIVWEQDGGLKMQRGSAPPTLLTATAGAPAIATLPRGGVIIVWESSSGTTASLQAGIIRP